MSMAEGDFGEHLVRLFITMEVSRRRRRWRGDKEGGAGSASDGDTWRGRHQGRSHGKEVTGWREDAERMTMGWRERGQ
jgi:hypothetical protein